MKITEDICSCKNDTFWDDGILHISSCTQDIVSSSLPLAILILALPAWILNILTSRSEKTSKQWTLVNNLRLAFSITTLALAAVFRLLLCLDSDWCHLDLVLFVFSILNIIFNTASVASLVSLRSSSSKTQFLFWLASSICNIPYLIQGLQDLQSVGDYKFIIPFMLEVLCLILLISQWLPYADIYQGEDGSSFAANLVFQWLNFLFVKGFRSKISVKDLPSLPKILSLKHILGKFEKFYDEKTTGLRRLLVPLLKSFGMKFLAGSLLRAINDVLIFASPQVLRKILRVIEQDGEAWKGYFWCVLLLVIALTQSTFSAQYFKLVYQVGFQMRTAVMSAVFRKSLKLSSASRQKYTTGEITNLIAIDAQRFVDVIPHLNVIWSAPLQIGLAVFFLYELVGNSAFAGMGLLFILVPANVIGNHIGKKIQTNQMNLKDQRILKMNEILQGIKVIKYYAWEKPFMSKVNDVRHKEVKTIKQYALVYSMMNVTFSTVPLLVTLCTFGVYIYLDPVHNILTAEKVFSCIAIFNILRIPLFMFPMFFMESIKLLVSLKRIGSFLDSEDIDNKYISNEDHEEDAFKVYDSAYSWDDKTEKETLKNIKIEAQKGELIAVIGKVGSGKSSLLSAILGEMSCKSGKILTSSNSYSYVSQQAWIQNMTIRDNILFGQQEHENWYKQVIEACALKPDFQILPGGDQTEIGEQGINLSGGQKQRVALARACYKQSEVYLFDDPLSAVDAHVAKHLFTNLIGPTGILRESTRIIVTHNLNFLNQMDRIILLDEGQIVLQGSHEQIKDDVKFQAYAQLYKEDTDAEEKEDVKDESVMKTDDYAEKMILDEKRQQGRVGIMNYVHYIKMLNPLIFLLIVSLYFVGEGLMVGCNLILVKWTDQVAIETLSLSQHSKYMAYYGTLNFFMFLCSLVYNIWTFFTMAKASIKMHGSLIEKTMHAPLSFFETNPSGRIINRFTSDLEVIDRKIPMEMADVIWCCANIISVFITISVIVPFILIALIPILLCFIGIQIFFTRTRCQIKRLESVAKAPIISHFSEAISGASTIRAFKEQERFQKEFEEKVEKHLTSNYINDMCNRWLSVRVEYLGNLLIFLVAVLTFAYKSSLSAGMAGLAITYSMMILDALSWAVRMFCELETDSVAIERIREYDELPQESDWDTKSKDSFPPDWPSSGKLEMDQVCAKYRPNLPEALMELNLVLQSGEKIGICGRTGAGKSTLASVILRIIEPSQGEIRFDGVDTRKIGLQELRSSITIVPQDSVLFSGSLKFNLDPWNNETEEELVKTLTKLGLGFKLDMVVTEGGSNLSMGERQLICLGRAILRKSKLLILDEATSAMDIETDTKITDLVKQEFGACSVLTIAHRLSTVLSGDRICVMEKGRITEEGSPEELLEDHQSKFFQMAKSSGLVL